MTNKKYNEYYYGCKVSRYGLENGKVDYACLREAIGGCVLCNNMEKRYLEPISGEMFRYYDIDNGYEEVTREEAEELDMCCIEEEPIDIYQWYIISDYGAKILMRETDEIVLFDEELEVYVWAVTHWGTGWDYVLTNIKLREKD